MARQIKVIYDALIAEKINQPTLTTLQPAIDDQQTLLSDLATPSKVAVWRLWMWLVATAIFTHETLWDLFKAEVEEIAANAIPGTVRWYQDQALKYQHGDPLLYIDNKFQYAVIDPSKQIIKRAAVVELGSQVRIKVAKLNGFTITPLSTPELSAFDAYINQIKFAGTNTATLSRLPDLLKVAYKVYYDPLLLTATGELISNPGKFPVEEAITGHIANLPFNGNLVLTQLTDAIQKAVGVVNPILQSAEATYGAVPYAPIVETYNPDAGHMIVDPLNPLSGSITYIPYV